MTIQLMDSVYWVGAIDWNQRDFHGYITERGTTYNSYLIMDKKITLVDMVRENFTGEWFERIKQITDPAKIDFLICNHIEKDHSGALPEFVKQFPKIKIFSTKTAKAGLIKYYGNGLPIETVKTGDTLSLGNQTIRFIEVPMVHWPDSMLSYVPEHKLLLSNDAFGQHLASSGHFDDEVDTSILMSEAAKYYANLLIHLSPFIQKTLKKITELKLEIDMIAPSHGIVWRKDPGRIIQAYNDWSLYKTKEKVIIIYDTMWKSTEKMAQIMAETVTAAGIEVKQLKLRENHRSDIMAELLDAGGFMVGSPTLHRNLFPTVADFLCYLKGLKPQKKVAAAFGSHGWSGEAVRLIMDVLKEIRLETIEPGVGVQYLPDENDNKQLKDLANKMITRLKTGQAA